MVNLDSQETKLIGEVPRSHLWPHIRLIHLRSQSYCKACGGTSDLEVHHIQPFHIHPELELDQKNLITLCEAVPRECHLHIGHLGNWKNFNPNIVSDANFLPCPPNS